MAVESEAASARLMLLLGLLQVQNTLKQAQAAVVMPIFTNLQGALSKALIAACIQGEGESQLLAVSQAQGLGPRVQRVGVSSLGFRVFWV